MLQAGIEIIWLALYHYYIQQISELEKGTAKRVVVRLITLGVLLFVHLPLPGWGGFGYRFWGWLIITGVLFLYVLFYDAKPLGQQWRKALAPGILIAGCAMAEQPADMILCTGAVSLVLLLLLSYERGCFQVRNSLLNLAVYALLGSYLWQCRNTAGAELLAGILALELLLFFSLEGTLSSYQRGFEARTERFQRDVLSRQYDEIKEIYLNMRSWRHDYHNHLQAMKAQIAAGQIEEMKRYLDNLEQNLDNVDTYVKSGNLMADAILNSKLTLAAKKDIKVDCKVILPNVLSVEDVDLCVLLGNLLDNALEACDKIPPQQRFLRIYMAVRRSQLYLSIQNSAKEELNFDERNYISQKRGSHGLGIKRVKALTDKYEGYLTLANEPGIFAAELTLPL